METLTKPIKQSLCLLGQRLALGEMWGCDC